MAWRGRATKPCHGMDRIRVGDLYGPLGRRTCLSFFCTAFARFATSSTELPNKGRGQRRPRLLGLLTRGQRSKGSSVSQETEATAHAAAEQEQEQ
jgi:hypothetical protein